MSYKKNYTDKFKIQGDIYLNFEDYKLLSKDSFEEKYLKIKRQRSTLNSNSSSFSLKKQFSKDNINEDNHKIHNIKQNNNNFIIEEKIIKYYKANNLQKNIEYFKTNSNIILTLYHTVINNKGIENCVLNNLFDSLKENNYYYYSSVDLKKIYDDYLNDFINLNKGTNFNSKNIKSLKKYDYKSGLKKLFINPVCVITNIIEDNLLFDSNFISHNLQNLLKNKKFIDIDNILEERNYNNLICQNDEVLQIDLSFYPQTLNFDFKILLKDYAKIISPLSNNDVSNYLPNKISGISSPKLYIFNNQCNYFLNKIFNYNNQNNYKSQFRRYILNISQNEDNILYHIFIPDLGQKKINFEKISLDYIKSLNVNFYYFNQKPNELLCLNPNQILFTFTKKNSSNNNNSNDNFYILEWNQCNITNQEDITSFILNNNKKDCIPILTTLVNIINRNIQIIPNDVLKMFKNLILNENIAEYKKQIFKNKMNIFTVFIDKYICEECMNEIFNYYIIYNDKILCLKCGMKKNNIKNIYEKYNEYEINYLHDRVNKKLSNLEDKSNIINCPQDCFIYKDKSNSIFQNSLNFEYSLYDFEIKYDLINKNIVSSIIPQTKSNETDIFEMKKINENDIYISKDELADRNKQIFINNNIMDNSNKKNDNELNNYIKKKIEFFNQNSLFNNNSFSANNNNNVRNSNNILYKNNNNNISNNSKKIENKNISKGVNFTDIY